MARRDDVEHLANIELFSECSKRDLQKLARVSEELRVARGETIVEQGDVGRTAYVIISGNATVRRARKKVATLGPGDVIGELSLLDKGPRTAYVVADTDMQLLALSAKNFHGVLDEIPSLSQKLLASLASRVRELDRAAFG